MHGISGTGKSTAAAAIALAFNAIRLRSDVERKRLFGINLHDGSQSSLDSNIYTSEATDATFLRLAETCKILLSWHYPVIIDATFLSISRRNEFKLLARSAGIDCIIFDCLASDEAIEKRLLKRRKLTNEVSEADIQIMKNQRLKQDGLTEEERKSTFSINTEIELALDDIAKFLTIHSKSSTD